MMLKGHSPAAFGAGCAGTLFVVLVVGAALWTSCHKTAQADAAHKSVTSKDVTGRAEADKLGACKAGTPYASCTISTSSSRASPQSPPRTAMHTCQESFEGHKALATQTTHIAWKVPVVGREAFASLCGMGLGKFAVGRGNVLRFEHRNASDPALPPLPTGLRLGVDVFLEGPQGMQLMAQWRTSPAVVCSKADDTALLGSTVVVHCTEKPPHAASSALLQGHPQATEGLPDVALVLDALEARGLGDSLMAKSQDMQHADAAVSHTPPTMRADSMRDLHMTEAYPMGGQAAGSPQQQDTDVHQVGIGNTARVLRGTYRGHSVAVKLLHPALVVGQRAAQGKRRHASTASAMNLRY